MRLIGIQSLCIANSLYILNRQTISSINVRTERRHGDLLSKIDEQRAALHRVNGMVEHIEDRMEGHRLGLPEKNWMPLNPNAMQHTIQ